MCWDKPIDSQSPTRLPSFLFSSPSRPNFRAAKIEISFKRAKLPAETLTTQAKAVHKMLQIVKKDAQIT